MRNQAWTSDGTLVNDIEIYREGSNIKVRDHLKNEIRDAGADEQTSLFNEEASLIPKRDLESELDALKTAVAKLKSK